MIRNRKKVLQGLEGVRHDFRQHFIPLGAMDTATQSKKEISNLTATMRNHLPLVSAFEKAAAPYPVYVGYDGIHRAERAGSYYNNLILLHAAADESSLLFIMAYTHELTHMAQDRAGLLRADDVPPPEKLVDFLAHNLCLEAAALATEVCSLYYLSNHSRLAQNNDEVREFYDDYVADTRGRTHLHGHVDEALRGRRIRSFDDMKPVWRKVFQAFFDPDSEFAKQYIHSFCESYLHRLKEAKDNGAALSKKSWGGLKDIKDIATLPGWGTLYDDEALPLLNHMVRASILQDRHVPLIDFTRRQAEKIVPPVLREDAVALLERIVSTGLVRI